MCYCGEYLLLRSGAGDGDAACGRVVHIGYHRFSSACYAFNRTKTVGVAG